MWAWQRRKGIFLSGLVRCETERDTEEIRGDDSAIVARLSVMWRCDYVGQFLLGSGESNLLQPPYVTSYIMTIKF